MGWDPVGSLRDDNPPVGYDIGTAINQRVMKSMRGQPTYFPYFAENPWDSRLNVYNAKGSNMRRVREGMARVRNDGLMHILSIGDSTMVGANGSNTIEQTSVPVAAAQTIADCLGKRMAGGIQPPTAGPSSITDRWATTGTVTISLPYAQMAASSTMTYKSQNRGTTVDIYLSHASTACTYQIDGGAAVPITAGDGSQNIRKIPVTGLSDTRHEVKINATTNYVYLVGISVMHTKGVAVHNIAYGGSRAGLGGATQNWMDNNNGSLQKSRKAVWDASGYSPDLVLIGIGGSDIGYDDSLANAIDSLETMCGWYPDATVMMTQMWNHTLADLGDWDAYLYAKYELADTLDIPFVDWNYRYGYLADAIASDVAGPDDMHPSHGAAFEMGRNVGNIVADAGPGHPVIRQITQAAYTALGTYDENVVYMIVG